MKKTSPWTESPGVHHKPVNHHHLSLSSTSHSVSSNPNPKNPEKPTMSSRNLSSPNPNNKPTVLFLALTLSLTLLLAAAAAYLLHRLYSSFIRRCRRRTLPFSPTSSSSLHHLQNFTYKDLKYATNDFSPSNSIGKGGSGTVFRGILRDGKLVAVKTLDPTTSFQTEREFQNEVEVLGSLNSKSPFIVSLLGFCAYKSKRLLVYEYMPNRSLQESLFGGSYNSRVLNWARRFEIVLDVSRALEFLHVECDPPVIHGDVKPSNVLLDWEYRAKLSDFGLSRVKHEEGEFGVNVDLFSQELSGNLAGGGGEGETPGIGTPVESCNNEVDFALALQASCSSKNSGIVNLNSVVCCNSNGNVGRVEKGKEVSIWNLENVDDWNNKGVVYDDEVFFSADHSKELKLCSDSKQWGKDWWWRQDGSGELCSKDYVMEWIGSQICPTVNADWDEEKKISPEDTNREDFVRLDNLKEANGTQLQEPKGFKTEESRGRVLRKKHRKMQEWWKEEYLDEISKKTTGNKLKRLETKCIKKGFRISRFDLIRRCKFHRRRKIGNNNHDGGDPNMEFSFRRGWKNKNGRSGGSEMGSGDLFSRELSSTTSMRGTLCYVAPEYGGCGYLMEKADIYSLGVLILVIVSGRRPLHVLSSPMKLEKANLIGWCRQLAHSGNVLDLVDERLKDEYNKEQASLCINLALACLQKMPELRPDIGEIVKILRGEMDLPPLPFEFSPSPPSKLFSKSRRKQKANAD